MKYLLAIMFSLITSTTVFGRIVSINTDETWNETTYKKVLISEKYTGDIKFSGYMMMKCKETKSPARCYELINAIGWHETKRGTISNTNIFGMLKYNYIQDKYKAVDKFIEKYDRRWFANNCYTMISQSQYSYDSYLTLKRGARTTPWIENCKWMTEKFNI